MQDFEFARPGFQNAFRVVPSVITPRLLLREVRSDDVNALYRMYSDPEVARFDNFEPMTRVSQAAAAVESFQMELGSHEKLRWAVTMRKDESAQSESWPMSGTSSGLACGRCGAVIGCCWLGNFDLIAQRCETGYELDRSCWNRGYASELVPALASFAFRTLGMNRIEAYVDRRNRASKRVLEKSGFRPEGILRQRDFYHGEFHDAELFSLLADDTGE